MDWVGLRFLVLRDRNLRLGFWVDGEPIVKEHAFGFDDEGSVISGTRGGGPQWLRSAMELPRAFWFSNLLRVADPRSFLVASIVTVGCCWTAGGRLVWF